MAVISPTIIKRDTYWLLTWANVGNGDTCEAIEFPRPGAGVGCCHVYGTFDSATLLLQGSAYGGSQWYTMQDHAGNAFSKTATAGDTLMCAGLHMRPSISGGLGSEDITVEVMYILGPEAYR